MLDTWPLVVERAKTNPRLIKPGQIKRQMKNDGGRQSSQYQQEYHYTDHTKYDPQSRSDDVSARCNIWDGDDQLIGYHS